MKGISSIAAASLVAAVSLANTCSVHAFLTSSSPLKPRCLFTRIQSTASDADRIKKAGAGITTQSPGGLSFYDPNENGKLQGTNNLMERIESGAAFTLAGVESQEPLLSNETPPEPTSPNPESTPNNAVANLHRNLTTNLTKLLNGQMESRFQGGGRSQY